MRATRQGIAFELDLGSFIDHKIFFKGAFRAHFTSFIKRTISGKELMLDLGSNIGFYSLVAARRGCRVVAFEPHPRVAEQFRTNLALNPDIASQVCFHERGVGRMAETLKLHAPPASAVNQGVASFRASEAALTFEVPLVTLDSWWIQEGRPKVGLVKIDTEGFDLKVILGAAELIQTCRPVLAFETEVLEFDGDDKCEWAEARELLRGSGYKYFWLDLYGRPHPARDLEAVQDLVAIAQ